MLGKSLFAKHEVNRIGNRTWPRPRRIGSEEVITDRFWLAYDMAPRYPRAGMESMAVKISGLLRQRGLLKRDLARALGVSPQTATDICKGRSSITVPHLRRLVEFFGLRADFWLDPDSLHPTTADEVSARVNQKVFELSQAGILDIEDPAGLFERLLILARNHRDEYLGLHGEALPQERRLLGLPGSTQGTVGRISAT